MNDAVLAKRPRLSVEEYVALCCRHLKTYWKRYTAPVVVLALMQMFIRVDVNYTNSLPDHVFITIKGWTSGIQYGDYIAYRFPNESPISPFRKGDHMVKIVLGKPGDEIKINDQRQVRIIRAGTLESTTDIPDFLGGVNAGISKTVSRAGKRLEPISAGIIPEGRFYAYAPHADSLDSRYALVGLIGTDDIIGRTFPIF